MSLAIASLEGLPAFIFAAIFCAAPREQSESAFLAVLLRDAQPHRLIFRCHQSRLFVDAPDGPKKNIGLE